MKLAGPLCKTVIHPKSIPVIPAHGKKQRGESVPDNPKVDIIGKDGTIRNIRVYSNEVLWDGKQQRQLIYHDITELQKGEEALKHQNKTSATLWIVH